MPRRPMCTSAACGGSDMRKNAAAATPTAPPACPLASLMCWGLWSGLGPSVGVRGVQKVARGGALVGLLVRMRMLLRPFRCSAFGCSSRDAHCTRAQYLPWEHLRAAHPEIRRDACFLAACTVFLRGKQEELVASVRVAVNGRERAQRLAATGLYNSLSLTVNKIFD